MNSADYEGRLFRAFGQTFRVSFYDNTCHKGRLVSYVCSGEIPSPVELLDDEERLLDGAKLAEFSVIIGEAL